MHHQQIPLPILEYLRGIDGEITDIAPLTGTSKSGVFLISTKRARYIAKSPAHAREISFYRELSHDLRAQGLPLPLLYWSGHHLQLPWILIEFFPALLPEHRWQGDPDVIKQLCALHSKTTSLGQRLQDPFVPTWTSQQNDKALECIDPKDRKKTKKLLEQFYQESQQFWQQRVLISGDANPRNWGVRIDGSIVEFDWQKVGLGPIAIDLATYICTDERYEVAQKIAHMYCQEMRPEHPLNGLEETALARQIMIGCAWNYVQFLNDYLERRREVPEKIIDHISMVFTDWLAVTSKQLVR